MFCLGNRQFCRRLRQILRDVSRAGEKGAGMNFFVGRQMLHGNEFIFMAAR
jgi:hypothetical protein